MQRCSPRVQLWLQCPSTLPAGHRHERLDHARDVRSVQALLLGKADQELPNEPCVRGLRVDVGRAGVLECLLKGAKLVVGAAVLARCHHALQRLPVGPGHRRRSAHHGGRGLRRGRGLQCGARLGRQHGGEVPHSGRQRRVGGPPARHLGEGQRHLGGLRAVLGLALREGQKELPSARRVGRVLLQLGRTGLGHGSPERPKLLVRAHVPVLLDDRLHLAPEVQRP
mmetsp:Transcript_53321/g.155351  ORF Transcript_53321/g.155351 Transcript_53321/m.155351 type:complete len:225 (+) Transcript_53321:792-1466(+)